MNNKRYKTLTELLQEYAHRRCVNYIIKTSIKEKETKINQDPYFLGLMGGLRDLGSGTYNPQHSSLFPYNDSYMEGYLDSLDESDDTSISTISNDYIACETCGFDHQTESYEAAAVHEHIDIDDQDIPEKF